MNLNDLLENYIPYPIRTKVSSIDPRLDVFWQDYLFETFRELSPKDRENVMKQILTPKHIIWNKDSKKFEYNPPPENAEGSDFESIIRKIPPQHKQMKALAIKLNEYLNTLKTMDDALKIAEFLESHFKKIYQINVEDNIELQVLKNKIHQEFTYQVADIIRNKKDWVLPKNHRGLNPSIIKTFFNEVYLKQQLLGFWFKTLRNRELDEFPYEIINTFLKKEHKVRQLEVVRASKYLFGIAPLPEFQSNPFMPRRFLQEETLFTRNRILLNGVAINTAMLANCDEKYTETFKKQVNCIITLETTVSQLVIDFLTKIEKYHDDNLLPLLFSPFDVNKRFETLLEQRLQQYEKLLTDNILEPLMDALKNLVKNDDEHEYLYIGLRQLFGNILSVFKDFQNQPLLMDNHQVAVLMGRLVAYASFLEKRHGEIFNMSAISDWERNHNQSQEPIGEIKKIVQKNIKQFRQLQKDIRAQEELVEKEPTFFEKLLKTKEKQAEKLEELKKDARQMAWEVHHKVFHLPKDFKQQMVHLEFESLLMFDEKLRNYAFPAGDNGVNRLPIVLTLPENRLDFDLSQFSSDLQLQSSKAH